MEFIELKILILAQIGIDIAVIIVCIYLIKKYSFFKWNSSLNSGLKVYETLMTDADRISEQFKNQLEEKKYMIKKLNQKLDKRIKDLNVMLNKADAILFDSKRYGITNQGSLDSQKKEIIKLAKQGGNIEYIADTLSIPREEVMLILDLKKKISQADSKEGVS